MYTHFNTIKSYVNGIIPNVYIHVQMSIGHFRFQILPKLPRVVAESVRTLLIPAHQCLNNLSQSF